MRGSAWLILVAMAFAAPSAAAEDSEESAACTTDDSISAVWPWLTDNGTENETQGGSGGNETAGGSNEPPTQETCGTFVAPFLFKTLTCRYWVMDPNAQDPTQLVRLDPDECLQAAIRDVLDGPRFSFPIHLRR